MKAILCQILRVIVVQAAAAGERVALDWPLLSLSSKVYVLPVVN
jgi:hypothetical protein